MQPLAGLTVVDLTRYLPGPFASRELLRLGARVVKIEPPDGDPMRPRARWYEALNAGKEIGLLGPQPSPSSHGACARRLVLEGFRPGVSERLGVGPDDARRVVYCSLTGFGAGGPHAPQAGHDLNYLGWAGVLADTAPACRRSRWPIWRRSAQPPSPRSSLRCSSVKGPAGAPASSSR